MGKNCPNLKHWTNNGRKLDPLRPDHEGTRVKVEMYKIKQRKCSQM